MSVEPVVFNDLVLAGIFEQMESVEVLSLCVRVCRQWHRVAHSCRHVALHIVRVCAKLEEQYRGVPQLSLTFVRQWIRELRLRTLCNALLRAEFDDSDNCAWSGGGDEAGPIYDVVRLLGHCILAAATARDDALLLSLGEQGSLKAIPFFCARDSGLRMTLTRLSLSLPRISPCVPVSGASPTLPLCPPVAP